MIHALSCASVMMHLESLERTQEFRVTVGFILRNSYALFCSLKASSKLDDMCQSLNPKIDNNFFFLLV